MSVDGAMPFVRVPNDLPEEVGDGDESAEIIDAIVAGDEGN